MIGVLPALIGIALATLALAFTARHVALDVDRRGGTGWLFGTLTLFFPPVGLAAWAIFRARNGIRGFRT